MVTPNEITGSFLSGHEDGKHGRAFQTPSDELFTKSPLGHEGSC